MARNPAKNISTSTTSTTSATNTPKTKPAKAYACTTCSKSFATSTARTSHWSATNHYPVHCSVCNKGFGSHEALAQHAEVHSRPVTKHVTHSKQSGSKSNVIRTNEVATGPRASTIEANLVDLTALLSLQSSAAAINSDRSNADSDGLAVKHQSLYQTNAFVYKSNVYSLLSLHEQEAIYAALLTACHTPERLRAEHYIMPGYNKSKNKNTHIQLSEFRKTPGSPVSPFPGQGKRRAVAIDCEMVGLVTGTECVAYLSAVDILTGEVLLNTYVNPVIRVRSWRTRYSGVTRNDMDHAIAHGQALRGWQSARRALWEHIDAETILVGHSLQNDLNVLGIFHSKIVDSAILSAQAVFPDILFDHFPRHWGLKKLSGYFLDLVIQTGKVGHNCLEDTLATRELVLWCLRFPEQLAQWGVLSRLEYERRLEEIRIAREKKQAEEEKKKKKEKGKQKEKENESVDSANTIVSGIDYSNGVPLPK